MGRRGPAPVPTFLLRARRSKLLPSRAGEPTPAPGIGPCPEWLSPQAQAMYQRLVEILQSRMGLAEIDQRAVIRYSESWARWVSAAKFIQQHGTTYAVKGKKGRIRSFQHFPEVASYNAMDRVLGQLERELGLTPRARGLVQAEGSPAPDTNLYPRLHAG